MGWPFSSPWTLMILAVSHQTHGEPSFSWPVLCLRDLLNTLLNCLSGKCLKQRSKHNLLDEQAWCLKTLKGMVCTAPTQQLVFLVKAFLAKVNVRALCALEAASFDGFSTTSIAPNSDLNILYPGPICTMVQQKHGSANIFIRGSQRQCIGSVLPCSFHICSTLKEELQSPGSLIVGSRDERSGAIILSFLHTGTVIQEKLQDSRAITRCSKMHWKQVKHACPMQEDFYHWLMAVKGRKRQRRCTCHTTFHLGGSAISSIVQEEGYHWCMSLLSCGNEGIYSLICCPSCHISAMVQ